MAPGSLPVVKRYDCAAGSGCANVSVIEVGNVTVYRVCGASGVGHARVMACIWVPIVGGAGGAGAIWIPRSEAAATGAVATNEVVPVRDTFTPPSVNELGRIASGSTLNVNAETSPGAQAAAMSPPGGAHTWTPCLSTTSGAKARPQVAFVGSGPLGTRTIAGPSTSKPPSAGRFWLPDGFQ